MKDKNKFVKIIAEYEKFNFSSLAPLRWVGDKVLVLDQLKLPDFEDYIECSSAEDIAKVIKEMNIRGAPAIGIAAGMGIALGLKKVSRSDLNMEFERIKQILISTRPTAVNLAWAVKEQEKLLHTLIKNNDDIYLGLKANSMKIHMDDVKYCRKIGEHGVKFLRKGIKILTHCNAGALATGDYGTALGVIRAAAGKFKNDIFVWIDETRPYLQGARLTAYEMFKEGIPSKLICDNMAGYLMSKKEVDCVIIGADRIAGNGDVANKIGSYSLAVLSKYHKIPFYVAAPHSTLDLKLKTGKEIIIEERSKIEMIKIGNKIIAPKNIDVFNPAFDVVPNKLITAIITEKGVFTPRD
ncbi:MAG: S-methyl-5-thioribose-1-phosphate isomerase [bacterium]|nr:S-methyl-5-thioribose-1-phosphate isomerase [bacterium]